MASDYEPDSILVVLLRTVRDGSGCEARRCERGDKAFPCYSPRLVAYSSPLRRRPPPPAPMRLTLGLVLSTTVAALPRLAKDALAPQVKLPDPDRHALRLMEFYNAPENQAADQIKRRSEASARDAEAECVVAGAQCCSNPSGEPFCLGGFSCDNDACVAVVAASPVAVAFAVAGAAVSRVVVEGCWRLRAFLFFVCQREACLGSRCGWLRR